MISRRKTTLVAVISGIALLVAATSGSFAGDAKEHSAAIQVDQDDPAVMNLVLNNASNIIEHYRGKGETVEVDVVAYSPGLHMFRAETSHASSKSPTRPFLRASDIPPATTRRKEWNGAKENPSA